MKKQNIIILGAIIFIALLATILWFVFKPNKNIPSNQPVNQPVNPAPQAEVPKYKRIDPPTLTVTANDPNLSNLIINDPELGEIATDRLIIKIKNGTPDSRIAEIVKTVEGKILEKLSGIDLWWVIELPRAPDASKIKAAIVTLKDFPEIDIAEGEKIVRAQ